MSEQLNPWDLLQPQDVTSRPVKLAYAIALYARLPSVLSKPLEASDTFLEATTPVKLPTMQCLRYPAD